MRVIKKGTKTENKIQCKNCLAVIGYYNSELNIKYEDFSDGIRFYLVQYFKCPCCGRDIEVTRDKA